jgi:ankyrin repeat protein
LQVGFVATMPTSQEFDQCKGYLEQGSTLNVAEFTAWFGAHNDGEWVKEKDEYGWTPLHYGIKHNAPGEVLALVRPPFDACQAYLKQGPALTVAEFAAWFGANNGGEWVKEKDEDGRTPLHLGMKHQAPAETIRLIADAWPDGAKQTTGTGKTPLHYGMIKEASVEVIKLLVEACPAAVKVKDEDGKTPLDYGVIGVPPEALAAHREGMSPVELCRSFLLEGAALNVAEFAAWIAANNDGEWVKENDEDGNTPLHFGMEHKAAAEAIKLLVQACPAGVKAKGWYARTPLHLGMRHNAPVDLIKLLVEACPAGVKERDRNGATPLLLGMKHNAPVEAINLLVQACPEAVKVKDRNGCTPLLLGMVHKAPAEAIKVFVDA